MGIFHQKTAAREPTNYSDYYFLDRIAPTLSADRAAHLMAVKAVLGGKHIPVLSGGLDPRAEENFEKYRDKGHFFDSDTVHENVFAELHGHHRAQSLEFTALPLSGYLGDLEPYEDYARSATVYNNKNNQPVYRVDRDEAGTVTAINYYAEGKPVRVDTYDRHHCLLMTEQFGATANPVAQSTNTDKPVVHSLMSRTLYSEDGRPVFAQTYSPSQLWILDEHAVPVRLFNTNAAMMAWWLMEHLDKRNHIYLAADNAIFDELASYKRLRPHLIPIIQDELKVAKLAGTPFPEIIVNELLNAKEYGQYADEVTTMPSWRSFKVKRSWSVFKRY